MPAPPYSGGKIMPISPSLPSSLTVVSGNSQASSHRMTFGAISRWANSRTVFFKCSCSSFNWKSKRYSPRSSLRDCVRHYQLQIPRSPTPARKCDWLGTPAAPDDKIGSTDRVQKFPIGMPRAGMAQNLAPNFSFKHGRQQSTKFSNRPVGNTAWAQTRSLQHNETTTGSVAKEDLSNLLTGDTFRPHEALSQRGSLLSPWPSPGYTRLAYRSAGFSNSLDNLRRNVAFVMGQRLALPRWLSE